MVSDALELACPDLQACDVHLCLHSMQALECGLERRSVTWALAKNTQIKVVISFEKTDLLSYHLCGVLFQV